MFGKLAISIQSLMKAIGNHTVALLKVLILSKFNVKLPRPAAESITILANGPTLNEDLAIVRRVAPSEFMCVNFFIHTDLYDELKPQYYVLCDPLFFITHPGSDLFERITKFYRELYQKTTWDLQLFVPKMYRKSFHAFVRRMEVSNEKIHVYFYNTTNFEGHTSIIQFLYQHKLGMPSPRNVTIPAMMLAIFIGFKKINLTGVSHDYHLGVKLNEDNTVMLKVPHFYDKDGKGVYKPYMKADRKSLYTMSELFLMMYKMFHSYEFVASFAKRNNVEVVNFTPGSFIDQFKKYRPAKAES